MHRPLSIRARVALSLVAMLLSLAGVGGTALWTAARTLDGFAETTLDGFAETTHEALDEALPLAGLQTDLVAVERAAVKVVLADSGKAAEYRTARSRLQAAFARIAVDGHLTEEGPLLRGARQSSGRAVLLLDAAVDSSPSTAPAAVRHLQDAERHIDAALDQLRRAEQISRADIVAEYRDAQADQRRSMAIMILVAGAGLGLALVGARSVVRGVVVPLDGLRNSVVALSEGTLGHRVSSVGRDDEFGELAESLNAMADALEHSHTQLKQHALHDDLTGLANRRQFKSRLDAALAVGGPSGRTAVLLVDLDGFKEINDGFGHHAGDDVLRQVASRLTKAVRASDTAARLGGDEFAVVLNGVSDDAITRQLVERVADVFDKPFVVAGTATRVRGSIGVVVQGRAGAGAEELLRRADAAMYSAKSVGGGIRYYDVDRDDVATGRQLMAELRVAIDQGELMLDYQPSVRMEDGLVTGAEALVRWQHPERGRLAPDQFLGLAEKSELIAPLTVWVLEEAVRQCRAWLDDGLDLCVAVNLSARSVVDHGLPAMVRDVLDRHGVPASHLVLEITETSLIDRPEDAGHVLAEIVDAGVNLAVDDFGTGYATLAWLKRLPFTALKIDRDFVGDLDVGSTGRELVRYTTELGTGLGKTVVAEGVESVEQWNALKQMGCQHAQGYHIGPPMPPGRFETWLQESLASGRYTVGGRGTGADPLRTPAPVA